MVRGSLPATTPSLPGLIWRRPGRAAALHIGMYNTGRSERWSRYIARVVAAAAIRDAYAQGSHVAAKRGAMHSPLIVRVTITRHEVHGTHRKRVTPARSPILVSSVSRVVVF